MLSPPGGSAPPPRENPGSATATGTALLSDWSENSLLWLFMIIFQFSQNFLPKGLLKIFVIDSHCKTAQSECTVSDFTPGIRVSVLPMLSLYSITTSF